MKTTALAPLLFTLQQPHDIQGFVVPSAGRVWTTAPKKSCQHLTFIKSTATDDEAPAIDVEVEFDPKQNLLDVAQQLKQDHGFLLVDSTAKKELNQAVKALEEEYDDNDDEFDQASLLGDWDLICSTSTSSKGIDTSKFPDPLQQLRTRVLKNTNQYLSVQQKILDKDNNEQIIDRIDHVLSYAPPSSLEDVLDNVPEAMQKLNLNPLDVSKSKLILIHKAKVDDDNKNTIALSLKSIVWNVAGTSKQLDPNGADIAGINLPFGEFLNNGKFETTYMDDTLRISRGKQGLVDQLRVFVRSKPEKDEEEGGGENVEEAEVVAAEVQEEDEEDDDDGAEAPSDVESSD